MTDEKQGSNGNSAAEREQLYELMLRKKGLHRAAGTSIGANGLDRGRVSFAQERIWFLQQVEPESPSYHIPLMVRIQGALAADVLERSFGEILRRHESLRTVFTERDGELWQEIIPHATFQLAVISLPEPVLNNEASFSEYFQQETRQLFDLERGPLWRLKLFRQAEDDHFLLLVLHHLVADGWSVGLILKELLAFYEAIRQNQSTPLPELSIQYLDFAIWQRQWLQGDVLHNEFAYWEKQLAGAPPVLELPVDYPRPRIQTSKGSFIEFKITESRLNSLKSLAAQYGATLFMVLLSVFQVQLYRYTNQADILVGTPVAGRERSELEGLIGLFVNTMVLRTNLAGNPGFEKLLEQVRRMALDAFAHQNLPFEKLVEMLRLERNMSYTPLFQVMFVMQNAPVPAMNLADLKVTPLTIDSGFAQFDLALTVWEEGGSLKGTFEYNSDLFDRSTTARMAGHFQVLLESILQEPGQPVAALSLLTDAEKQQLLVEWNDTAADYPHQSTIIELFEQQVHGSALAPAIMFGAETLDYEQLNRRANHLALFLKEKGVGPETLVAIYLEISVDLIVAVLAVLKAGGAYIPLDTAYPRERLALMMDDAGIKLVLTGIRLEEELSGGNRQVICLDRDWPGEGLDPVPNLAPQAAPHNLACIIYTSGSTGQPKGVQLEHRGLVNLITSFIESYQAGPGDRILPLTAPGSASFVGEILPLLCAGGTLVLADKASFLDFDRLLALIANHGITIISTVPAVMAKLNAEEIDLPKLRLILSGGEALSWHEIDRLVERTTVVNGYGLTETSVCTTFIKLDSAALAAGQSITIGRPIMNHQVYILDPYFNCLPVGAQGEIYIGGLGLARGYVNNPELTRQRFIDNPFIPGERLYRTGDRAARLADGTINYLGRMDKQVKIRGYRIEMGEIETRLGEHPAVRDLVLTVREDHRHEKRLVAYLVLNENQAVQSNELRDWLREKLPEYMVPSAFEFLKSLPLNANGKVDSEALPEPVGLRPELAADFKAPQTETQTMIANIWKPILNLSQVGIHDNFFDLGGHSLLLTQVHRQLKAAITKELTIIDLFKYPDIASLAAYLDESRPVNQMSDSYRQVQERTLRQREMLQRQQQFAANRFKGRSNS